MISNEVKDKIIIKEITIDHIKDVFELLNILYNNSINYDSFVKKYNKKINDTMSYNIIALYNNQVIGLLTSDIQIKLRREKNQCFIEDLIVKEEYRSLGVGHKLIENVKTYAKDNGCEVIKLSSFISNIKAHKFYEDNGFIKKSFEFKYNI